MVRQFVDNEVIPIAEEHDHEDKFPEAVVEQMKELGLFGVTIPEEYGGMGLDLTTYAMIVEELSRGWISVSGIVNTHFIGSYLLMKFGTDEQKQEFLPRMATGEIRAAFSLSEPEVGSDVQGIKSTAKKRRRRLGAQRPEDVGHQRPALGRRVRPDEDRPEGRPALHGHDLLHHREGAGRRARTTGLTVPPQIKKMGYKGVESTELVYDGYRCPPERILGGEEDGARQGLRPDDGRARGGPRQRGRPRRGHRPARARAGAALLAGAQDLRQADREHQAIQFKLADMATKVEAARLLTLKAARMKDAGERSDLEAGMAKLFASETGKEVVEEAFRIHGGYGYSKEYEIERLYRDAPLLLIGEGTSEIQRMVIGKKLLQRNKI